MPNTREKLIELIRMPVTIFPDAVVSPHITFTLPYAEYLADHLIANGVGFLPKWIPVTERLPEKKGDVLVCDTREDFVSTWEYLGNGLWLYDNIFWGTDDITHWMPLPEAPKGE